MPSRKVRNMRSQKNQNIRKIRSSKRLSKSRRRLSHKIRGGSGHTQQVTGRFDPLPLPPPGTPVSALSKTAILRAEITALKKKIVFLKKERKELDDIYNIDLTSLITLRRKIKEYGKLLKQKKEDITNDFRELLNKIDKYPTEYDTLFKSTEIDKNIDKRMREGWFVLDPSLQESTFSSSELETIRQQNAIAEGNRMKEAVKLGTLSSNSSDDEGGGNLPKDE